MWEIRSAFNGSRHPWTDLKICWRLNGFPKSVQAFTFFFFYLLHNTSHTSISRAHVQKEQKKKGSFNHKNVQGKNKWRERGRGWGLCVFEEKRKIESEGVRVLCVKKRAREKVRVGTLCVKKREREKVREWGELGF